MIEREETLELLPVGIQDFDGKKKDCDLFFLDKDTSVAYYRELKANLDLDTEKRAATVQKIQFIDSKLKQMYPDYQINSGVCSYTAWTKAHLLSASPAMRNKIDKFTQVGLKVDFTKDLFLKMKQNYSKDEWNDFCRWIGKQITRGAA